MNNIVKFKDKLRLCHLLGIEQLIVGVNKMDAPSVNYAESRFDEIKSEVDKMLTKIGYVQYALYIFLMSNIKYIYIITYRYKTKKIPSIPMSGFKGDNLASKSENMKWYKGFTVKVKKKK